MVRQPAHPDPAAVSLAEMLSALGDPVRLRILATLADGDEHQRGDFDVDIGPSTLSHHMKTLREAGVTTHRMAGTRCFVSLRTELLDRFPNVLRSVLDAYAAEA